MPRWEQYLKFFFLVIFKIKASKLDMIDVKPAKGFVKPQGKVIINFKISANIVHKFFNKDTTRNVDY